MPLPTWKRSETWGILVALATLVLVIVFASRDWTSFRSARFRADDTQAVLNLVSELFSSAQDLETGQRGFVLSGEPSYLAPYEAAKATILSQMSELTRMTANDSSQQARVRRIDELLGQKMAELQNTIDLRRTKGFQAAVEVVDSGLGKAIMDRIRVEVSGFQGDGRARLRRLEQEEDLYRFRASAIASGGSALLFVMLAIAAVLVRQRGDARERALRAAAAGKREVEQVRDLLQTTLQSIGDAVITTDAEGLVTFLNPVAQDLTGWRDGYLGRPLDQVFRIVNEYTRKLVESPVDKVRRTGMVAGLANHTLLLARDGREIPIDDSGAPIRDAQSATVGFVLVFRDIVERRQAEALLRESEDRFRTMANAAPVLLWVTGADGNVTFVNRQWLDFTGRSLEDELKLGWTDEVHPEDRAAVLRIRGAAREHPAAYSFECRLRRADGQDRSMICSEAPRFDPDGCFAGYVGAWFDVSDLKETQRSLAISEQRFRVLLAGTTSMVWQTDASGACVDPQPGWEEFTGQTFEQYCGFGGSTAMHPDDREAVARNWQVAVANRGGFTMEYRLWHAATQEYRHVTSRGTPVLDAHGEILQWIGTITDTTDRYRLDEKVRQAAKLESLGILAGGIAHDFNNLLVGILGNASLLQSLAGDSQQEEIAGDILAAGERAGALTRQMLAYSGRGRFVVDTTDISAETAQILPLLRSSIPKHVNLKLELAEGLPTAELDRSQFQQLVMNLVINAAEAIEPPSGTVTVTTRALSLTGQDIASQFPGETLQPGPYIVLDVQDTGHGMDPQTQAKIFDPFFTTKFAGRGLGLAAAAGIIRGHKGAIKVTSAPGEGASFRVYLPADGTPLRVPLPEPPAKSSGHAATVLVVDDEEVVRKLATSVLTRHGFRVLIAADGREAVAVLQANREEVAAVVLDLTMPVMSGEEALPRLREIHPTVRILASSGFNQTEAVRRFGNAIDGFIQKPYTSANLLAALQATLRQTTA